MSTSTLPDPLEIKPNRNLYAIMLAVGCAVFVLGGIAIVFNAENATQILTGILAIAFFGGGGVFAIPKMLKREVSLILNPSGLEYPSIWGSATIPWRDVEKVGVSTMGSTPMLGLRLKKYDRYLEKMSPELAQNIAQAMPYMKLLAKAAILLDPPSAAASLWSQLSGKEDASAALRSFGKVGSLVQILMWNRKTTGYDVLMTWADLDRPANALAAVIENYRQAYS